MAPPCRAPTSPEHRSPRLGAGLAWRPTWGLSENSSKPIFFSKTKFFLVGRNFNNSVSVYQKAIIGQPPWSSDFLLIFKRVRLGFAPPQNFGGASVLASESIYKQKQIVFNKGLVRYAATNKKKTYTVRHTKPLTRSASKPTGKIFCEKQVVQEANSKIKFLV